MTRALPLLALIVGGCAVSDPEGDWVRQLQVIAVQAQPPVLAPDVPVTVTVTVLDPEERGAEVALWACTERDGACIERELSEGVGVPLSAWARSGEVRGDRFVARFDLRLPPALFEQAAEERAAVVLWAVACVDGACPVIDAIARDPAPGTLSFARTASLLADPEAWLAQIDEGLASAAIKVLPVRHTVDNANPQVSAPKDGLTVGLGEGGGRVRLDLLDDGGRSLDVRAYSTFGGVTVRSTGEAEAEIAWTAPDRPGTGRIYAVVTDGAGGLEVWRGDVVVDE